jgi:hypothetical protein
VRDRLGEEKRDRSRVCILDSACALLLRAPDLIQLPRCRHPLVRHSTRDTALLGDFAKDNLPTHLALRGKLFARFRGRRGLARASDLHIRPLISWGLVHEVVEAHWIGHIRV